jgi:hypothetical protein
MAIVRYRTRKRKTENMANTDVRSDSEIPPRSPASMVLDSDDARNYSDDDVDFPPTAHPVRELVTASIFVLSVICLIIWCGSKLL